MFQESEALLGITNEGGASKDQEEASDHRSLEKKEQHGE
jgi:hypothetical protein